MDYGFQVLESSFCQCDFGFLELYFGFQNLASGFHKGIFFLIPDSSCRNFKDSLTRGMCGGNYFVFECVIRPLTDKLTETT